MNMQWILIILIIFNLILLVILLYKQSSKQLSQLIETRMLEQFTRNRETSDGAFKSLREEVQLSITRFSEFLMNRMMEISRLQNSQFENIRQTVEQRLRLLQEDNNKKLEEMRQTVDEKLHTTLETRLGEAFKQVGDRLEKVHQGLGEMHKLAVGVGDLKNILSNVRTRGMLGEIQLENQLSQLMSPGQYEKNVKTKEGSNDFVEFAIKLPGKDETEPWVWLPLDSKFPIQQYEILTQVYQAGDKEQIERVTRKMITDVKNFAKMIRDKYIDPPRTTDFALMYLPAEGLYAEVLRLDGVFEVLQREYRVIPVGPTTLAAILNSLQMGFRTLAIEKRSSEVWKLLATVKSHFGKFGDLLDKTRKKLDEAGQTIDDATKKSRYIEGRLSRVHELPEEEKDDEF